MIFSCAVRCKIPDLLLPPCIYQKSTFNSRNDVENYFLHVCKSDPQTRPETVKVFHFLEVKVAMLLLYAINNEPTLLKFYV